MTTYTVLLDTLAGEMIATINSDTINDMPIEDFIGEMMDGVNERHERIEGRLIEVYA